MNWRGHKLQCTGRVEAAKLTDHQLAQLDEIVHLGTDGTMEAPQMNHADKLPPEQMQNFLEWSLESSQEAAAAREKVHRKMVKERKALGPLGFINIPVPPDQKIELHGARTDVLLCFGVRSDVLLTSSGT